MWQLTSEANQLGYIMTADTAGEGDDSKINWCGIRKSHSYSILSAFTMTDKNGASHRCLLLRDLRLIGRDEELHAVRHIHFLYFPILNAWTSSIVPILLLYSAAQVSFFSGLCSPRCVSYNTS